MLIYITLILFCFLLSAFKLPKSIENSALILIALFLCFGYMTGTDWISYEKYFNDVSFGERMLSTRESGYFFIQSIVKSWGIEFWTFHITVKVLIFIVLVNFIRRFEANVFLFLTLFIPESGLYLFVDCPFRNLIGVGFGLIAFNYLFKKKTAAFFVFSILATLFHLSAVVLFLVYFIYRVNIKTHIVLIATVIIYIVAFNADFLIKTIYLPLTNISPVIHDRLKGYFLDSDFIANTVNIGTYIRLFVLLILLLFKNQIIAGDERRSYVYNLAIIFLFFYPLGVSMKIMQRFSLYLYPFYILSIIYLLKSVQINMNRYILYSFFVLLSFFQTYNLVTRDFRYVPYSNYIDHWIRKDFPDIEYRYNYNRKHSPYRKP